MQQMARRTREETKERSIFRELGGWLLYILIIIGLTYLIITFVGQRTRVSGSSMETTLSNGDNLIVDKLTYHFKEPKRYDIIVFPYKYEENTYYIKRIIGLPGETVQIADGRVTIDGVLLEEPSEREEIRDARRASEPVVLGQAEYFVLGDNRNGSSDSRDSDIGNVSAEQIIGRVVFWP